MDFFDKSESAPDKHVQFDEGKEHDNEGEKFVEINKGDITIYLESEEKEVFAGTTSEEVLKPSEVVEPPETKSDEVDDDSMETRIKVIEEVSGVEEEDIQELSIGVVETVAPVEIIDADNNISKTKEVKTIEADFNSMEKYVDENAYPSVDSVKSMEEKENTDELSDNILYEAPEEEIQ